MSEHDKRVQQLTEFKDIVNNKITLENQGFNLEGLYGKESHFNSYKEMLKQLSTDFDNQRYKVIARNTINILSHLPKKLQTIKETLELHYGSLLELADNQSRENHSQELEIKELKSELKSSDKTIKHLKETHQNEIIQDLKEKINTLTNNQQHMMNQQQPNYNQEDTIQEQYAEPIYNEVQQDFIEQQEEITPKEENTPKTYLIQKLHTEILTEMKGMGLYPLHKGDVEDKKEVYLGYWKQKINTMNYIELNATPSPSIIENLESYKEYGDDYLDNIEV